MTVTELRRAANGRVMVRGGEVGLRLEALLKDAGMGNISGPIIVKGAPRGHGDL